MRARPADPPADAATTFALPVSYAPMEAALVPALPSGPAWRFEPKWDGFRCLAFKAGDAVDLRSKAGQPFNRYFPELVEAVGALRAANAVLDGEIVIPDGDVLSFDTLLMRIHPAASRVARLSSEHPALFIVFDLLVDADGNARVEQPLAQRREELERFVAAHRPKGSPIRLSPQASERAQAEQWIASLGGGLDGVMAKRGDLAYRSGERDGMQKWKRMRTADCVVGGFRYAAKGGVVGSLLLGLYDDEGLLHHVGFAANLPAADRPELTRLLASKTAEPGFSGRRPGGPSRWSTERTGEWTPLDGSIVVEVQYDHWSGERFRHGTKLLRFRPDKAPRQCTLAQVAQEAASSLALLDATTARR